MRIYVKSNSAKFYPDPRLKRLSLGFFEEVAPRRRKEEEEEEEEVEEEEVI